MANIKTEVTRKKDREIFGKTNISYTLIRTGTCVEQMFVFFGKFGGLCFLFTSVLRFSFLSYYRFYSGTVFFRPRKRFIPSLALCEGGDLT